MLRPLPLALAALAALAAGCGSAGPSDEPLPTVVELRAEFDRQPAGRGLVREGARGDRYGTSAVHLTRGEGAPARFRVNLVSENPAVAITLFVDGEQARDLRAGEELNARFLYGSTRGDGSAVWQKGGPVRPAPLRGLPAKRGGGVWSSAAARSIPSARSAGTSLKGGGRPEGPAARRG